MKVLYDATLTAGLLFFHFYFFLQSQSTDVCDLVRLPVPHCV